MDLLELQEIMVAKGLVIRAIPLENVSVYEVRHAAYYTTGVIYYDERMKRDMLRVITTNVHGGKFMIERASTGTMIPFKRKFYDTIEEAVNSILEK